MTLDLGAALALCGWATDADVPDAILADRLAEMGWGDAATIRRALALSRVTGPRGLLVRLAAWDQQRCAVCAAALRGDGMSPTGYRCDRCRAFRRPAPSRADLLAAIGAALAEAGDVRHDVTPEDEAAYGVTVWDEIVRYFVESWCCPRCGSGWLTVMAQNDPANPACPAGACGWSGPAAALLPPLMSRVELDGHVAELKKGRTS